MTAPPVVALPLGELFDIDEWPLASLVPDSVRDLLVVNGSFDMEAGSARAGILTTSEVALTIPGVEVVKLILGPAAGATEIVVAATASPFSLSIATTCVLRIAAEVLRPIDPVTNAPDPTAAHLDIPLGNTSIVVDQTGDLDLQFTGAATIPKCMVGSSGVVIEANTIRWLNSSSANLPHSTPSSFVGLYLTGVTATVTGLPVSSGVLSMNDVFIGTGGFSGKVAWSDPALQWQDPAFLGVLTGDLAGFKFGLSRVAIELRQNAFVECDITGDVFVPYLDRRLGLSIGLDGNGGFTAAAGLPTSLPAETGVCAGKPGYLLHVDVGGFLSFDLDSLKFSYPAGRKPVLELTGGLELTISGLDAPPFDFKGFRIDGDGNVAIEGGWLDLSKATIAPFHGFPIEITKIGFGTQSNGCRWLGLNGGLKMADGLPVGVSVEGLRICWDPKASNILNSLSVSLDGIGVQLKIEGTLELDGAVSFFTDTTTGTHGFRGHVHLNLISVKLVVDARLIVGRTATGDTFFYLFLAADLPTGIPLFTTGTAIYGFAGLVAVSMRPDKRADEDWYYGWYLRSPAGVSDEKKWAVAPGAFAGGLGTTIGTASDDGFSFSTKILLCLLLPGPTFVLNGKGSFVTKRPSSTSVTSSGAFDALLVLDIPAKLFQANLGATYNIPDVLEIAGVAEAKFSWAPTPPPDVWHVYVGEKQPMSKRLKAQLVKILRANSYFQLNRSGIELGAWIGLSEDYRYGPARAWFTASIEGAGVVSWNPQSFNATLDMTGDAGISAFGVKVRSSLNSGVTVKAPDPWYVHMHIHLAIEVDFGFFGWGFDVDLPLTWGDADSPLPLPATPVVQLIAAEHMKADETFALQSGSATIPADARPVIIFQRPVRDLASIGNPNTPNVPADHVGPRDFSYQLLHVALVRKSGTNRVLSAAGLVDVSGTTATLYGSPPAQPSMPNVSGAVLELPDIGASAHVTTASNGALTLSSALQGGLHPYRLRAGVDTQAVVIDDLVEGAYSTATVTLHASAGTADVFAGGTLVQGGGAWTVIGHSGATVIIRTAGTFPAHGAALLAGPAGPLLEGQWLPVDDRASADVPYPTTKLMIWARTPFAWFRRNDDETYRGFMRNNPDWACGPKPAQMPACHRFADLAPGVLPSDFASEQLDGSSDGGVEVKAAGPDGVDRQLAFGLASLTQQASGLVTLSFEPPIERITVKYDADWSDDLNVITPESPGQGKGSGKGSSAGPTRPIGGASLTGLSAGAVVASTPLESDTSEASLSGTFDEAEIAAGYLVVSEVCVFPAWRCVTFGDGTFPNQTTGRIFYSELLLESADMMKVENAILVVTPAPSNAQASGIATGIVQRGWPPRRIVFETPHVPGTPDPDPEMYDRFAGGWRTPTALPYMTVHGMGAPQESFVPGIGHAIMGAERRPGDLPPGGGGAFMRRTPGGGRARVTALPSMPGGAPPIPQSGPPIGPPVTPGRETLDWLKGLERPLGIGGGFIPTPFASVAITFPRPTTRVRVTLDSPGTIVGWAGSTEVSQAVLTSSGVANLKASDSYIDRVVITNIGSVRVTEVCYDGSLTGMAWADREGYQSSTERSIDWMYREDALLAPGSYSLEVTTAIDIGGASPDTRWFSDTVNFTVGQPPGITPPSGNADTDKHYPTGGPLNALATYVDYTVPSAGERPFYRSYDVGVAFNEPYVSRMFIAAGKSLTVAVVDSNDRDRRKDARNQWGTGPVLELSHEEMLETTTYNSSAETCQTVSVERIPSNEEVSAGGGELLGPAELHGGELRAAGAAKPVYRFEFVSSQFVDFAHHLATHDRFCRSIAVPGAAATSLAALISGIDAAAAAVTAAALDYEAKMLTATAGEPTNEQLLAFESAKTTMRAARAGLRAARSEAFMAQWLAYFAAPPSSVLPANVEVARLVAANGSTSLALDSPEPIHWDRVRLTDLSRSTLVPLRERRIAFDREAFGAPDVGTFEFAGVVWTTDAELRVVDGRLEPRMPGAWKLDIALTRATSVTFTVSVDGSGALTVSGTGTSVSPQVVQGPTALGATVDLTVTGDPLTSVNLALSSGMVHVQAVRVVEWHRAVPVRGQLRLSRAVLPSTTASDAHSVDIVAYKDTPLAGWSVRWSDALSPDVGGTYHTFADTAKVDDGQRVRLFGAVAAPSQIPGMEVFGGGLTGVVPATGVVWQLVDPTGNVMHEMASMPDTNFPAPLEVVPFVKEDESRVLLVPRAGDIEPGHWRLRLDFMRDGGPELPKLSVGGVASVESMELEFTAI